MVGLSIEEAINLVVKEQLGILPEMPVPSPVSETEDRDDEEIKRDETSQSTPPESSEESDGQCTSPEIPMHSRFDAMSLVSNVDPNPFNYLGPNTANNTSDTNRGYDFASPLYSEFPFDPLPETDFDGGSLLREALATRVGNLRRLRGTKKPIPDEEKDERYFERRKRNNLAAKKSRDARKFREDSVAVRANLLMQENTYLKAQVATLRNEAASLTDLYLQQSAHDKPLSPEELLKLESPEEISAFLNRF